MHKQLLYGLDKVVDLLNLVKMLHSNACVT